MFVSVIKFVCSMEYVYLVRSVSSDFVHAVCDSREHALEWIASNGYFIGRLRIEPFGLFKGY